MRTAEELVRFAISKVGTPYVYGSHGEVLTQKQIDEWAAAYPSVYTKSYIAKAQQFIGRECTDCAGLIDWFLGTDQSSYYYRENAVKRVAIGKLDETMIGWAVWKSGHIGIYIGAGKVVEARGINYGTIISNVGDVAWKEVCKLAGIEYADPKKPEFKLIECKAPFGIVVTASALNIRDYPKTGAVVGSYTNGTKIYPAGKVYVSDTDVWLKTNKGYISRKHVKGWLDELEGRWYVEPGDNYPRDTLKEIGGSVYYFNDAGWLETNKALTVWAAEDGSLTAQKE